MGKEKWLIDYSDETYIDDLIKRALFQTHDSEAADSVWMILISVMKDITSAMDENKLHQLKKDGDTLSDTLLNELAEKTIRRIREKNSFSMDVERENQTISLVFQALKKYRKGVADSVCRPVFAEREQNLRTERLTTTGYLSLQDREQIFTRLKSLKNSALRKLFLNGESTVNQLLLRGLVSIDISETNISHLARLLAEKLLGTIRDDNEATTQFVAEMEKWLGEEKNRELIQTLQHEWKDRQMREEKPRRQ